MLSTEPCQTLGESCLLTVYIYLSCWLSISSVFCGDICSRVSKKGNVM